MGRGGGAAVLESFRVDRKDGCGKWAVGSSPALAGAAEPADLNGIFRFPVYVTRKVIYLGYHRCTATNNTRPARTRSELRAASSRRAAAALREEPSEPSERCKGPAFPLLMGSG